MSASPEFIPVVCNEAGKYAGRCYLEKISSVQMLNGQSIANASTLNKSGFNTGDEVTIKFGAKDFRGTVNFGQEEDILSECAESPCSTCSFPKRKTAEPRKKSSTDLGRGWKWCNRQREQSVAQLEESARNHEFQVRMHTV